MSGRAVQADRQRATSCCRSAAGARDASTASALQAVQAHEPALEDFTSILGGTSKTQADAPEFRDLNLDRIVDAMTKGRAEYGLKKKGEPLQTSISRDL